MRFEQGFTITLITLYTKLDAECHKRVLVIVDCRLVLWSLVYVMGESR